MDIKTQVGNDLADRLARYAGEIMKVAGEVPSTREGRHVKDQLTRSGTAPGAHYAEARSAQSAADFIHKLSLAAKEARESLHWLRTSVYAGFITRDVRRLMDESAQVAAILSASLKTAQRNQQERARNGSADRPQP